MGRTARREASDKAYLTQCDRGGREECGAVSTLPAVVAQGSPLQGAVAAGDGARGSLARGLHPVADRPVRVPSLAAGMTSEARRLPHTHHLGQPGSFAEAA